MRGLGAPIVGAVFLAASCGEPAPQALNPSAPNITADFLYGDIDEAKLEKVIKRFPLPHYADQASCEAAGERWGGMYDNVLLASPKPTFPGETPFDYRCWVEPEPLADGGEVCAGPTDCIGNCIAVLKGVETLTAKCQPTKDDPNCTAIYDGKEWVPTGCTHV